MPTWERRIAELEAELEASHAFVGRLRAQVAEARAEVARLRERWEALREWRGEAEQRYHQQRGRWPHSAYHEGRGDEAREWLDKLAALERAGEAPEKG